MDTIANKMTMQTDVRLCEERRRQMDFNYAKLKGRIVEKYGTQGRFAEELGVAQNTVSRKLNGENSFTRNDMLIWAELLEIDRSKIGSYFFE